MAHPPPIRLWCQNIIITTIIGVTALAFFACHPLIHLMWPQFNPSLRIPSNVGSRCAHHGIPGTSLGISKSTDSVQSLMHQVPARLRIAPMMMNAVGRARAMDYVMFSVLPKIEELLNRTNSKIRAVVLHTRTTERVPSHSATSVSQQIVNFFHPFNGHTSPLDSVRCAHLDLEMVLADWQTLAMQTKGIMGNDPPVAKEPTRCRYPADLGGVKVRRDMAEIEQAVRVRQTTQEHIEKQLHDLQQLFTAIADVVQKLIDFKEACSSVRALALEGAGDALKVYFVTRAPALNKEIPLKSR
ncbi:hypothetical protein EDD18DRAFT_1098548 [Armillaria luteobubalina]|uniref:Uncharacterized protein n=1 Tax=Armillaria luteobubalina TaxID=153913 RepID=A0AA39UVL8_9AGAR|nr:hypothetical protein EDD18DRAFT_1098548 [Armillaria luteobubalina]